MRVCVWICVFQADTLRASLARDVCTSLAIEPERIRVTELKPAQSFSSPKYSDLGQRGPCIRAGACVSLHTQALSPGTSFTQYTSLFHCKSFITALTMAEMLLQLSRCPRRWRLGSRVCRRPAQRSERRRPSVGHQAPVRDESKARDPAL